MKPAQRLAMIPALSLLIALAIGQGSGLPHANAHGNFVPQETGTENVVPKPLEDIGIEEKLGAQVDPQLTFRNEKGETVPLASFFKGHKPVLLSLAYYSCPSLCNFHLNGLTDAFRDLKAPLGEEFEFVVVSIEPKENPELAAQKKAAYIESYGRPEGAKGWHFLTGDQAQITALAKQVGFKYRWDEESKQWAHTAAAYVLTPDGKISRYLYGIVFDPKVLRLSMVEASDGKIGTIVDKLTLFCFHFDPKGNKYAIAAFNVMRAGGALTVFILALFLIPFWFRNRREERESRNSSGSGPGKNPPGPKLGENRLQGEA